MDKRKWNQAVSLAEQVFKLLLFSYAAMGACNLTYGKPIISWTMYAAFGLGGVLAALRAVRFREFLSMPGLMCAAALWGSYILASAANFAHFNKESLVFLILWTFYFFLLYTHPADREFTCVKREFRMASAVYLLHNTVLVCISIGMLLVGYAHVYVDPNNAGYEVASGIFTGRLWGAYQDPNLGSVMGCISIILCAYWMYRTKKTLLRLLLGADMGLTLFYIAMSDSRNGMVSLGVLLAVGFALFWFPRRGNKAAGIALGAAAMAVLLAVGIMLPVLVQRTYNQASAALTQVSGEVPETAHTEPALLQTQPEETVPQQMQAEEPAGQTPLPTIGRNYDMGGDISNRRFSVWKSGIELGLCKPLTGLSFTGIKPYAREHLPDTFVVADESWIFNTFDNELINIFASLGFPGLIVVLAWFFLAVKWVFKKLLPVSREDGAELCTWIVIVAVYVVSALFQGTMFYQTTPNTVFFWLVFGYLAVGLNRRK